MRATQVQKATLTTHSPEQTLEFGRRLGSQLKPGAIVALIGGLGAGKTWFAKGLALGLEVPNHEYVNSPAFDIIHEYKGRLPVVHMDFYRLDALSETDRMWIDEYLRSDNVVIIEWADKFISDFAPTYLKVEIQLGSGEDDRCFHLSSIGEDHLTLVEEIAAWSEFLE